MGKKATPAAGGTVGVTICPARGRAGLLPGRGGTRAPVPYRIRVGRARASQREPVEKKSNPNRGGTARVANARPGGEPDCCPGGGGPGQQNYSVSMLAMQGSCEIFLGPFDPLRAASGQALRVPPFGLCSGSKTGQAFVERMRACGDKKQPQPWGERPGLRMPGPGESRTVARAGGDPSNRIILSPRRRIKGVARFFWRGC